MDEENECDGNLGEYLKSISNSFDQFMGNVLDIEKMVEVDVPDGYEEVYYRILYSYAITALETFLCDCMIESIKDNDLMTDAFADYWIEVYKRRTPKRLQINPDDAEGLVALSKLGGLFDKAVLMAITHVWHRIDDAEKAYEKVFGITFINKDMLKEAVEIRHHIIHRGGKDTEGWQVDVFKDDVIGLLKIIEQFAQDIHDKLGSES